MNTALDYMVLSLAASPLATMLVSLYKLARPAASSMSIVALALLSGILMAFLIAAAQGIITTITLQIGAVIILAGLLAGGVAAGVRATDSASDAKRTGNN